MSQKFIFRFSVTFYFGLGADIVRMENDLPWGSGFLRRLSRNLKMQMPEAECFSLRNLYYKRGCRSADGSSAPCCLLKRRVARNPTHSATALR